MDENAVTSSVPIEPPRRIITACTMWRRYTGKGLLGYLREFWQHRNLIWSFCHIELRQTIIRSRLSYVWWLLDPLLDTLCFVFLIMALGYRSGEGIPYLLFILVALTPWRLSLGCWMGSTNLWLQYSSVVTQVRFPYLILIFGRFLNEFILYLLAYIIVFGVCMAYGYFPRPSWALLPVVIVLHAVVTLAFMFLFSVLFFLFADFNRLLPYLLRIWFYCSPALYPFKGLPEWIQRIMLWNPMTLIFHSYRACLLTGELFPVQTFILYAVCVVILFLGTLFLFIRFEPHLTRHL